MLFAFNGKSNVREYGEIIFLNSFISIFSTYYFYFSKIRKYEQFQVASLNVNHSDHCINSINLQKT